MGGSGVPSDPRPGGGGLGLCRPSGGPTAPDPSPHSGWSPAPRVPWGAALGAAGGPPDTLLRPESVSECVRVCVSVRRRLAGPGSTRLATRSLASLPRRVDVVLRAAPQFTAVGWAQDVFTSGLGDASCPHCLSWQVCARLVGHFRLLLVYSSVKSVSREDELQLFQ